MERHVQSTRSRMIHWMIIVTLAALPLAAQAPRACPIPEPPLNTQGIQKGVSGYQPLEAHLRLLYPLKGVQEAALEIRYLVRGELYLSEVLNLASVELPAPEPEVKGGERRRSTEKPAFRDILKNGFEEFRQPRLGQTGQPPQRFAAISSTSSGWWSCSR